MARADLIVDLVKYAASGNKAMAKKVTEAIIAEEREKQHTILADRLQNELMKAPAVSPSNGTTSNGAGNGGNAPIAHSKQPDTAARSELQLQPVDTGTLPSRLIEKLWC